eukprot:6728990-Pyramimonas_sp.AAC.2
MESVRASGARWPATRCCKKPRRTSIWPFATTRAFIGGPIGNRNTASYMSERVLKDWDAGHG